MGNASVYLKLISKNTSPPTGVNEGQVTDGDLTPFRHRVELVSTGVRKTNNATITLRIPHDGTFTRKAPNLMDEAARDAYLIEARIDQTTPSGIRQGELFRVQLGEPSVVEEEGVGEVLKIPCISLEYVGKEDLASRHDILKTPKERFENIVTEHNAKVDSVLFTFSTGDIDIPNNEALKQDWTPFGLTKATELLGEVIDRLGEAPQLGGTLKDYYYDFDPEPLVTRAMKIFAEELGNRSSGATIDPLSVSPFGAEKDKSIVSNFKDYKNLIILKAHPLGGALPMEHARFASNFLHAKVRQVYDAGTTYAKDDLVRFFDGTTLNTVRFYKSKVDGNVGNTPPNGAIQPQSNAFWEEDFYVDNPTELSKWTSNLDDWIANMAEGPPSGYAGYFVDWNIARANYDKEDFTNFYSHLSIKNVTRISSNPPTGTELYDGIRILVGTSPTGDFIGQANKVAEYDRSVFPAVWRFSDSPQLNDTVHDMSTGRVLRWNGSAWVIVWDVNTDNSKASPFHACKSLGLVTGATGVANSAIRATFEWLPALLGGNDINKSSRGAWLTFWFPFPRLNGIHGNIGHEYGGSGASFPPNAFLNTYNLDSNRKGLVGYHRGLDSEDHGRVSALRFKLRVGMFTSTDDSKLAKGVKTIPMIFWAIDKFDRIFFHEFNLGMNNRWEDIRIPFGPKAPQNLYFGRLDELVTIFGYTLPFDFFLEEKEYTGVKFDWRFVKGWGVFYKENYEDNGLYTGAQDAVIDSLFESFVQNYHNTVEFLYNTITGAPKAEVTNVRVHHANIEIDELYFEKELIVSSQDSTTNDPRMELVRMESIQDYLTAKAKAQAVEARRRFFPQFWHVKAAGDNRLRLGRSFIMQGPRVPNSPQTPVCVEAKHIFDDDGYFVEMFAIRKFVL